MQPHFAKQLYKNVIAGPPVYCLWQAPDETHPTKETCFLTSLLQTQVLLPHPPAVKQRVHIYLLLKPYAMPWLLGYPPSQNPLICFPAPCWIQPSPAASASPLGHSVPAGTAGVAAAGYREPPRANTALLWGNKPVTHFFTYQNSCELE